MLLACVILQVTSLPELTTTAVASDALPPAVPPAPKPKMVETTVDVSKYASKAAALEAYWTPARMKEAKSLDRRTTDKITRPEAPTAKKTAKASVARRPPTSQQNKVGRIFAQIEGTEGDTKCTGFSVPPAPGQSGVVETAGHCVLGDSGDKFTNVIFVPAWDPGDPVDQTPYGIFPLSRSVTTYNPKEPADPATDWGFYEAEPNEEGRLLSATVGSIPFWKADNVSKSGEPFQATGLYYDDGKSSMCEAWTQRIKLNDDPSDDRFEDSFWTYDCPIPGGASGGALLVEPTGDCREDEPGAIGILTHSDDPGTVPHLTLGPLHSDAVVRGYFEITDHDYSGTCGLPPAIVSMGDSYISGEGGRWAGNAATSAAGSAWGTDRATVNCNGDESVCEHDPSRVYGDTGYDKGAQACDRSDSAEILGVETPDVPVERRFNIACSGATTDNVTSTGFKGQRPQIDDLRDIAKKNKVRTVVLSIGGNDLKFSELLQDCVKAYFLPSVFNKGCRGSMEKEFSERLDPVQAKVVNTVEAIQGVLRKAGQEDGSYQIVLQSYPNPLPLARDFRDPENAPLPPANYSRYLKGGCPFLDADADWAHTSVVPRISAMLERAADEAEVSFLDLQEAFAGHELCSSTTRQADSSHTLASPLKAKDAEWVRWVPYLVEDLKDAPWQVQGNQQEAIHPNHYGQLALSACLTKILQKLGTSPGDSVCVSRPSSSPGSVDDTVNHNADLSKGNRRGPVAGLPDWSRAGFRGGENLPSATSYTSDPACNLTPSALEQQFNVKPNDGRDDTAGLQGAIDRIREKCTPDASPGKLSVINLPKGVLNVSKQLGVDASYLVIRGQGSDPGNGSRVVFRPDENTRYDTLTAKNERWAQEFMEWTCASAEVSTPLVGSGGWIWPGRGLFRVQTREPAERYIERCGFPSKVPENRRDLFEGSINQHWDSGVTVAGTAADANYAARQGDRVIQLNTKAKMDAFKAGGYLWVGAANSLKFYQSQGVDVVKADDPRMENLHMRQQVFTISSVDSSRRTITIDKPLEFDLPVDSTSDGSPPLGVGTAKPYTSKVTPLKMITDVGFEDFSFTQDINGLPKLTGGTYQFSPSQAVHNYGNMAPEYAMHGVVFKWAANSWMRGVRADMVGSHPVVTEVAKNIQVEHSVFDGSWNKGKGGNGYLRGSRVWDSVYAYNASRNLRHFTFQWAASGNVAIGNDFDSDLNLHGGWERHNLFENNTVRVPYNHSSGECETNCGGEGGAGDKGTWWPIYWTAGTKGISWSGSSGPQNVFFRNTLTKQTSKDGPYEPYATYIDPNRIFQFGSAEANPATFQHLTIGSTPLFDWGGAENISFLGGHGVNGNRRDPAPSLFLKHYRP
ncbi:hypothetical protein ACSHXN_44810 (plasmid) [Streptomyces sp. HUAS TT11]|uniref:hypothetical protein n=1 Tax=Streptomyces sp. HUAS TT11 TaxID=3447508 RepID=UPI003F66060C